MPSPLQWKIWHALPQNPTTARQARGPAGGYGVGDGTRDLPGRQMRLQAGGEGVVLGAGKFFGEFWFWGIFFPSNPVAPLCFLRN